jgi:hypothetical protein
MTRLIDLSICLENNAASDSPAALPKLIWEGHEAGREIGYCHPEKRHNLEVLPPTGFRVCCFPVKVRAGWTRAVAFVED